MSFFRRYTASRTCKTCGTVGAKKICSACGGETALPQKFNAKKCVIDGIKFDSQREGKRWIVLRSLEQTGEITELRRQVSYSFVINGIKITSYRADFVYKNKHGEEVVEDAKGFKTKDYLLRKKLMLAVYGITITEV